MEVGEHLIPWGGSEKCLGLEVLEWGAATTTDEGLTTTVDLTQGDVDASQTDDEPSTWRIDIPSVSLGGTILVCATASKSGVATDGPDGILVSYEGGDYDPPPVRYQTMVTDAIDPRRTMVAHVEHTESAATGLIITFLGGDDLATFETITVLPMEDVIPVRAVPYFGGAFTPSGSQTIPEVTGGAPTGQWLQIVAVVPVPDTPDPTTWTGGQGGPAHNQHFVDDAENVTIEDGGVGDTCPEATWTITAGSPQLTLGAVTIQFMPREAFVPLEVVNVDEDLPWKFFSNAEITYLMQADSPGLPLVLEGIFEPSSRPNVPYSIYQVGGGVYGWIVATENDPGLVATFDLSSEATGDADGPPWEAPPPVLRPRFKTGTVPYASLMRTGSSLTPAAANDPWAIEAAANNGEREIVLASGPTGTSPDHASFTGDETPDHWRVSQGQVTCAVPDDGGGEG